MKKISIVLSGIMLIGISGTSFAGKPTDVALMHCGCTAEGDDLEFTYQVVNSNSERGHKNHVIDSEKTCYFDDEPVGTYVRTANDCTLADGIWTDVGWCGDTPPVEGDDCGDVVPD